VLMRRKDDTRKRGAEIPVRVGAFDPIDLPGVLLEDLSDRTLESEHDIASG
jgi:hypothetical protein